MASMVRSRSRKHLKEIAVDQTSSPCRQEFRQRDNQAVANSLNHAQARQAPMSHEHLLQSIITATEQSSPAFPIRNWQPARYTPSGFDGLRQGNFNHRVHGRHRDITEDTRRCAWMSRWMRETPGRLFAIGEGSPIMDLYRPGPLQVLSASPSEQRDTKVPCPRPVLPRPLGSDIHERLPSRRS